MTPATAVTRNAVQVISNQHLFTLGKLQDIKKKKIGQFLFLKAESRPFKRERRMGRSPHSLSFSPAQNWVTKLQRRLPLKPERNSQNYAFYSTARGQGQSMVVIPEILTWGSEREPGLRWTVIATPMPHFILAWDMGDHQTLPLRSHTICATSLLGNVLGSLQCGLIQPDWSFNKR